MNSAIIQYMHANYDTPWYISQAQEVGGLRMRISTSEQGQSFEHITIDDLLVGKA